MLVGETAYNLPDSVFPPHSPNAGTSRYSFTYWSVPSPGSTACTTQHASNPKDEAGDEVFEAGWRSSFRSEHIGGVQFVMADGRVRFVSNSVDHDTLDAMASGDGGELFNDR